MAGSLESSDVLVTLSPGEGKLETVLTSSVENYYGDAIRATMRRTLEDLGVTSARMEAVDHGALDCAIRARITTAVRRAEEAGPTVVAAPLSQARMSIVVDKVLTVSTPGTWVDLLATQYGIAVNPSRPELRTALKKSGLPVKDIYELRALAERINGPAAPYQPPRERVAARVLGRRGEEQDLIYTVRCISERRQHTACTTN